MVQLLCPIGCQGVQVILEAVDVAGAKAEHNVALRHVL